MEETNTASDTDDVSGLSRSQSKDQIVIALDFGTTFSGIAYAFKKEDKPDVVSVLDWQGMSLRSLWTQSLTSVRSRRLSTAKSANRNQLRSR